MKTRDLWAVAVMVPALCAGAHGQKVADRVYGQPNFSVNQYGNTDLPPSSRMYKPLGCAPTADGVYISDHEYNRVLYFPGQTTTATRVYGQPDFDSLDANHGGLSATSLSGPWGIAADSTGLYVCDTNNSRVLFYPNGQTTPTRVYGQPGFTSGSPNYGGVSASSLAYPEEVAPDGHGGIYVSDSANNRVLYFPPEQTTATRVYGQPDFTTTVQALNQSGMAYPKGVGVVSDGIYVTDHLNNRVLFYPLAGGPATRVYGQPDFTSMAPNNPVIGPNSFQQPNGIATVGDDLYVCDYLGSRVLYFPAGSQAATVVYGETDFTTVRMLWGGVTGHGFYVPWNVAAGPDGLYVCDAYNARVLHFNIDTAPMPFSLLFDRQPEGGREKEPLAVQPQLVVRFTDGRVADTYNGPVEVRLKPGVGPEWAQLTGTATVNAVAGVATFTDLSISCPGTFTLTGFAGTLRIPESAPVVVGAAPGTRVAGDVNGDGKLTPADVVLTLKYLSGVEVMPS